MNTILIPVPSHASKEKMKTCIRVVTDKRTDRLHFLHVLTYPPAVDMVDIMATQTDLALEEMREKERVEFFQFTEEFKKEGYQVEEAIPMGFFNQEFLALVDSVKPSLILMFTSGSHSVVEDIFGTNTSHIFEKILAPVLVVSADADLKNLQSAVVGLSLENEDLEVLKKVFVFAENLNVELKFVKIDNNFQLDIINDESVLNTLQELYPGKMPSIVHRIAEDVADGLQAYANESKSDLIVLLTTKRNFIEKLFHKSVTKDLVLHSKKPLLIYHY